jgi:hypothetical protein
MEPHGDRAVAPRVVELMTPIGGEYNLDPQPLRRLIERAQLVPRCGGEEQDSHCGLLIGDCRLN